MKKYAKILILAMIIILASALTVKAADATANLNLSSTEVERGDTFTVTLNVSCEEGINGLEGTFSYDEEKLELVSQGVVDTTNWSNLGEGQDFAILHTSADTATSADILKLTFKVKDTAEIGTTAKITVSDIKVDSDAQTNSTKEIGTKEVEVSIKEKQADEDPNEKTLANIKIKNNPTKVTYKVGEKFDKTGLVVEAEYSDGTTKEVTNYTYAPAQELKLTDTKITITYKEGDITKTAEQKITVLAGTNTTDNKDNTQADKEINYAGLENYALVIIPIVVLVAVISYKKYKQYKNI